jgi:HAD superfamily hydrolase (TIGR01490 family)
VTDQAAQTLDERLAGKAVLLTGASGFVGKAVLAMALRELPSLGRIVVLLRAADGEAAARRLAADVLAGPAFEGIEADGRISAVAGDVASEDLVGLAGIDVLIHCAASVSFEQPLDEMLELNGRGPARLVRALRAAGSDPHVVHVSTAYAAGRRTGLVLERPSGTAPAEPEIDLDAELEAARAWRRDVEAESRLPHHQRRLVAEAKQAVGPAGGPAVGARSEDLRRAWVYQELVARGRERSRALGWSDSYGLSKALGERLLQAEQPRALSIVRPTIVESALRTPYPGWLESLKVADPVILAHAAGMIPRFPGNPSARLDLVPVDLVASACLAAAAFEPDDVRTMQIAGGARNPITVAEIAEIVTDYFRERPLAGEDGLPVEVPAFRMTSHRRALSLIDRSERLLDAGRTLVDRVPLPRSNEIELRLHREQRKLERLRRLADIYGPYVEIDCVFDDRTTRELLEQLHPDDRERFDFDVADFEWEDYLREVHLPALRALAPPPPPEERAERRVGIDGPPALAIFDVEGVVLDTTIAHFYAWLRTRDMPELDKLLWSAGIATRVPGWLRADRRSRAAFNRRFYRLYKDLSVRDLRAQAAAALSDFILPRMQQEAVRRIRAHRRRGDRVVLITGTLDFLVEPLEHLADELVAARLVERGGRFTGELAEPPLTADGRASLAAHMAAEHGVDLADCHAYGDSVADLALLELVGHPHPINPDFRLAREARRRGWPVEEWHTEPGAKSRPPAPVEVA